MNQRILFTCVGGTDPVRNLRDGAMLHIIRHYLPQKVYIVLSKEMEVLHKKDDRYSKAIDKFCHDFHHDIKVEFIFSKIEDVSDFDAFGDLFEQYLTKIVQENVSAEILLNISSGSLQMDMAMCLLSTNVKFTNTTVIQVTTPEKQANKSAATTKKDYDVDVEIELNEDNKQGADNRCLTPQLFKVKRALALKQVQTLLENYEYKSAKLILDSFDLADTNSKAKILTEHLLLRQDFKTKEAKKWIVEENFGINLFPIENPKCAEETEFFLVLQNLSKTGKITEFTLRLNPFVIRMQELYLLKKYSFDCKKIKKRNSQNIEEVKRDKLQAINPTMFKAIDSNFNNGFQDNFPSIVLYNIIIKFLGNGEEAANYLEFFNMCEKINQERNTSAHTLYGMDESDLKKIGITSEEILKTFRKLLLSCYGKECKQQIFDIYDRVNAIIMEQL